MASTTAVPNPVPTSRESRRRKKKPTTTKLHQSAAKESRAVRNPSVPFSWKSEKAEQIYSSKLIDALRKVSLNSSTSSSAPTSSSPSAAASTSSSAPPPPAPPRGRAVREAADRALAVAAKGRTRWSRAILMKNRLKIKFMKTKKRPRGLAAASAAAPANTGATGRRPRVGILRLKKGNGKNLPAVQRKVKVLGRLVPGCGKESFPVILEEATDYIEALQMQIRTMTALLNSSVAASASGGGSTEVERTGERPAPGN